MKNLTITFLLISFLSLCSGALIGQSCTPDVTINQHGYYPDKLDTATEQLAYSMTIQAYSKRDTSFQGISATIDSIIIERITGLPSGLSYVCNPPNCRFPSLKTGCINIFGTTPNGSAGNYPLVIEVLVKATAGGSFKQTFRQDVNDFDIVVKDDNVAGNSSIIEGLLSIYPNPTNHEINIINPNFVQFNVQLISISGQVLVDQPASKTVNTAINTANLATGIYTMLIKTLAGQIYDHKIQVIH